MHPESVGKERTRPQAQLQISIIQSQKTSKDKQLKSSHYGLRDCYNPFFKLIKPGFIQIIICMKFGISYESIGDTPNSIYPRFML